MKQKYIIFSLFLLIFSACSNNQINTSNINTSQDSIQINSSSEKEALSPTKENFLKILKTNNDGLEYLNSYPNTQIISFKKINPQEFETLKNQTKYKELFIDLPQKELYQVDFNGGSSLSLTTIIDLENAKVIKIFGILIMGMG